MRHDSQYCDPPASLGFEEDFELHHGRKPDGDYELHHWCRDWDGLPIDGTSPEFASCTCTWSHPDIEALAEEVMARHLIEPEDELDPEEDLED